MKAIMSLLVLAPTIAFSTTHNCQTEDGVSINLTKNEDKYQIEIKEDLELGVGYWDKETLPAATYTEYQDINKEIGYYFQESAYIKVVEESELKTLYFYGQHDSAPRALFEKLPLSCK